MMLVSTYSYAQKISPYECKQTKEKIKIDGNLDEDAWQKAKPLLLKRNKDGKPPAQKTVAKMLWDYNNLYISFVCDDKDICATMNERDMHLYKEEAVEAFIDQDGNPMTYFEFQVNPLNAHFDALVLGDAYPEGRSLIMSYNPESFKSAVLKGRNKWTGEIAISFKDMEIHPKPALLIRMNLFRIDRSNCNFEESASSPTLGRFHNYERFGYIRLIENKNGRTIYPSSVWKGKGDNVNAIDDGIIPEVSSDQACERFTWWPRKGTEEWIELRYDKPRTISECRLMWFDDTEQGGLCGLPENWKIQFLENGAWIDVKSPKSFPVKKDSLYKINFPPVKTSAIRMVVKLRDGLSGGVLEWSCD
jgi:hypothetical protein